MEVEYCAFAEKRLVNTWFLLSARYFMGQKGIYRVRLFTSASFRKNF